MRNEACIRKERRSRNNVRDRMQSQFGFVPYGLGLGGEQEVKVRDGVLGCGAEVPKAVRNVCLPEGVGALQAPDEDWDAVGGTTPAQGVARGECNDIVWIFGALGESVQDALGVLQPGTKGAQGEEPRIPSRGGVGHDVQQGWQCIGADSVEGPEAPLLSVCLWRGRGEAADFRDRLASHGTEHGKHFDRPLSAGVRLVDQGSIEEPRKALEGEHEPGLERTGFVGQPAQRGGNCVGADVAYGLGTLGPCVPPWKLSLEAAGGREPLGKGLTTVVGLRLRNDEECCHDGRASGAPRRDEPGSTLLHGSILLRRSSTLNSQVPAILR